MGISKLFSVTLSNPESHSHLSSLDVVTMTFNVAVTVETSISVPPVHVNCTLNRSRRAALSAIEGQIPATGAVVTSPYPEVTCIVDMEGSVRVFLHKVAVLKGVKETKSSYHLRKWDVFHN